MNEIFLSASVPVAGRGDFYKDADPYLIQFAVREFVIATLGRRKIIFGGHPAITPMINAICQDLGLNYMECVVLYQSQFFTQQFPDENKQFTNVVYTEAIENNREASLLLMRQQMLSRPNLTAAVFIGGMEGVLEEHALFTKLHPLASVLAIASPGGAAKQLAATLSTPEKPISLGLDFSSQFYKGLGISPLEKRVS